MQEMNELEKKLVATAMFSLKYSEAIGLRSQKLSSILGTIFRTSQEQIKNFSPQELSLLIVHLYDIKEEYFGEYLNIFRQEMVSHIINNTSCIVEQLDGLNAVENFYYDFYGNKDENVNVYDIIRKFNFFDIIKKLT